MTYNDKSSSFQELLLRDKSVSIHHKNIKSLAIETFKVLQGLCPPISNEVFVQRDCPYNMRGNNNLTRRKVNSVKYGTESISFLAPKIWDILPKEIKDSDNIDVFKTKIKKWVPKNCPCRLCKVYIPQLGFI